MTDSWEKIAYIAWGFVGSLIGVMAKMHVNRVEKDSAIEKEIREKEIKRIEQILSDEKEQRKEEINKLGAVFLDEIKELRSDFAKGLKIEGEFRVEVLKRYGNMIKKHDDLIEDLFIKKVSKELCEERHKS